MKIVAVAKEDVACVTGGAKVAFYNMLKLFAENGHKVYGVFYNENSDYTQEEIYENASLTNLSDGKSSYSEAFDKYIQDVVPDSIIFHFAAQIFETKFDEGRNASIPTVLMFHSRPDFYENYLSKINFKNINLICTTVLMDDFIKMAKNYTGENVPCITIGNEIHQQTEFAQLNFDKKNMIFFSRIDNCKGIDFLVDSFALVDKKVSDWKINLYGTYNSESAKEGLLKYIIKKDLKNQINLCGCISKEESKKAFLDSDFCVYPSYVEGFGIGLAEALSYGLPCIGLKRATGVNELIKDGYNGYLVDKDENLFAEKIIELIENKEKRIEMGKNAVESVKKYSSDVINEKWLKLLNEIETKGNLKNLESDAPKTVIVPFLLSEIDTLSAICNLKTNQIYNHLLEMVFSIINVGNIKIITIFGFPIKVKRTFSKNK